MSISAKMQAFGEKSSWIRKMFEQGEKMKAETLGTTAITAALSGGYTLRTVGVEREPGALHHAARRRGPGRRDHRHLRRGVAFR